MGVTGRVGRQAGRVLAPRLVGRMPHAATAAVREALHRAIDGVGPLPPAAQAAEAQLREQRGGVDRAIHEVIENHVRYAGVQGFAANLGGLVTQALTLPAHISGLAVLQCRMVAGIAHLRGHDLDDPRVQQAILVTVLGPDAVTRLVRNRTLPAPPMALATAPVLDPELEQTIAAEVAAHLMTGVAGRRMATMVGRRVPLVGGLVGAGADGYLTWKVGRYADRELLPRNAR